MIAARRLQRSFADGLIAEEVQDLWEPWMRWHPLQPALPQNSSPPAFASPGALFSMAGAVRDRTNATTCQVWSSGRLAGGIPPEIPFWMAL